MKIKLYTFNIEINDLNGSYFINTNRKDANIRFDKIKNHFNLETNVLHYKSRVNYFFCIFLFLFYFIKIFIRTFKYFESCVISLNEVQYKNLNVILKSNETNDVISKLLIYSEHENITWLLLYRLRKYNITVFCYLHGVPLYSKKKSYFSTLLYSKSFVSNYFLPNQILLKRLKFVFNLYSITSPILNLSTYDIYSSSFNLLSNNRFNSSKRIVICLSNHRWMDLNNDLIDIATELSRIKLPIFLRPHPSLSKSRMSKNLFNNFPVSLELDKNYIYIMGVSALYFDLCGLVNNKIFRFAYKDDDNFGVPNNLFYKKNILIESVKQKYFEM
mgnify:FL=1